MTYNFCQTFLITLTACTRVNDCSAKFSNNWQQYTHTHNQCFVNHQSKNMSKAIGEYVKKIQV